MFEHVAFAQRQSEMTNSLSGFVTKLLSAEKEKRFTARQIAQHVLETERTWCQNKKAKSAALKSDNDLVQQIIAEIGSMRPTLQRGHPELKTTSERPKKYYWSDKTEEEEVEEPSAATSDEAALSEADLYPLLAKYLRSELDVYSKRVNERKSTNSLQSGSNQWLYPDLVGMEDLFSSWADDVQKLVKETSHQHASLWSFEVKLKLNRANLRQVYFQAVSNSAWANYGYLVAAEISGADTMSELRMLHGLHGIGVIHLDPENPSESQIVIPSRERKDVDRATCSRISKENPDFRAYLKLVRQFYQTGDPRKEGWDEPGGFGHF